MEHFLLVFKVLFVWSFLVWKMRYTCTKKLMEIWYLLSTEKFLFWTFREWKIRSFLRQKVDGKMIFTSHWKVIVLNFYVIGYTIFFQPKSWCKVNIWLVFLSFPWYSRTWEIWLFVQWPCFLFTSILLDIRYNHYWTISWININCWFFFSSISYF